jgi:hypothetical protein
VSNTAGWHHDTSTRSGLGIPSAGGAWQIRQQKNYDKPSGWVAFIVIRPVSIFIWLHFKTNGE